MRKFSRGEKVVLRDFPLGRASKITGKVVGILPNEFYNVLLTNGLNEGIIKKYKSYQLLKEEEALDDLGEDKTGKINTNDHQG